METSSREPDLHRPEVQALLKKYWRTNVGIMIGLLVLWAAFGLGGGVLAADWLNQVNLPGTGFPLGFWFAHQGSIFAFVVLILIYCLLMNRLDGRHHADLEQLETGEAP